MKKQGEELIKKEKRIGTDARNREIEVWKRLEAAIYVDNKAHDQENDNQ